MIYYNHFLRLTQGERDGFEPDSPSMEKGEVPADTISIFGIFREFQQSPWKCAETNNGRQVFKDVTLRYKSLTIP